VLKRIAALELLDSTCCEMIG